MCDGISRIRNSWFQGGPPEKKGVTERYLVFGEARRWMVDQLNLGNGDILDVGSGHGFLSFEVASRTGSDVYGLDSLGGDQMRMAFRAARLGKFSDRISFVAADARKMPFPNHRFSAVVSFNALQDVYMTIGEDAVSQVVREACRVLRTGGVLGLADNFFPECLHNEKQKLYAQIHRDEFKASLPSVEAILSHLGTLKDVKQVQYDPKINLSEEEARIELKDIVDAKPFDRVFDFESIWKKYGARIRTVGLSYPNVLLISGTKR